MKIFKKFQKASTDLENDLVTAVIPAYNHQDYVQETITSLLNQTHRNIELVIFNDGSTDNTEARIKELLPQCEKRFVRLEFISKPNEGLAATLNRAIDWAKGDYLYLAASDDVAMPHAVETLYKFLSKHKNYALVVGDNQIINEKSQRCFWDEHRNNTTIENAVYHSFGEYLLKRKNRRLDSRKFGTYKTLLKRNYIMNGKMFRKQSLLNVGKYKAGMKFEDWYMNLQLSKFYKMKYIDEILFSYRWHNTNSTKNQDYIKDGAMIILDYEKQNHRQWFEKYSKPKRKFHSEFLQQICNIIKKFLKKI